MKYILLSMLLLLAARANYAQNRELIWGDEFEYEGIPDTDKWGFEIGNGCPNICGWGNNEAQYYTNSPINARVENGSLVIEARKESQNGFDFTSSKVVSIGKGSWQYGYIEVRAKLPKGRGVWPAIWMLPTLDRDLEWPLDGEIDIMEHVGYNPGMIYGTIHTQKFNHSIGTQKSDSIYLDDLYDAYHTYAIDWTKDKISWLVDGESYYTIERGDEGEEGWPFDKPFHIIFNVAIGGDWGGRHGIDENIWPQKMEIDYIRVYADAQNTSSVNKE